MFFRRRRNNSYRSRDRDGQRRDGPWLSWPKRRRARGLLALLGEFFSWFGFLLLVTGAVVGGGMYFLHTRFDDAVRSHVEAKFRAAYPKYRVVLRGARRIEGQGIELRGLSIAEAGFGASAKPLVQVDELLLHCNASVEDLIAGRMNAQQVSIRRLKVHAVRGPDGVWNLEKLIPLPKFSSRQLPIVIENSTAEIQLAAADSPAQVVEVRTLKLAPHAIPNDPNPARSWKFDAVLAGQLAQQVAVAGDYDLAGKLWNVRGEVKALQLKPELAALMPVEFNLARTRLNEAIAAEDVAITSAQGKVQQATWLDGVQATANATFQATNVDPGELPFRFTVEGQIVGRIEDQRLPFPLSDLKLPFRSDGKSLTIRDAVARVGQATLHMTCEIGGFHADAPCSVKLSTQGLAINRQLVGALPELWRDRWNMLAPEGLIDAEASLTFDGRQVRQQAVIDCKDVSFAYYKIPYRLTNGLGRVDWEDGRLTFDGFRAFANGREVLFSGDVRNPGPNYDGHVDVVVDDPIPIDEKMLAAIPESAQRVVRQLKPNGFVTGQAHFERHDSNPPVSRREMTIGVKDCAATYELFPYPLSHIDGTIRMSDGQWTVQDLKGSNDSAWVTCSGGWGPDERDVTRVNLEFNATDVPLEDELRDALKPDAQNVWKSIRPRGTLDTVKLSVQYDSQRRQTSVDVTATKQPAAQNVEGRSISIKPTWLPYQLDDVEGTLRLRDNVTELLNVRGKHAETLVQLSGVVNTPPNAPWEVKLEPLSVDRIVMNHALASAMPQRLSQAMAKLNVTGPLNMHGSMVLTGQPGSTVPRSTNWNLDFDVEDGGIACGVRLDHIHGGVLLQGGLDERGLVSQGELKVDSVFYNGVQFTKVGGPISLDDERVVFGEWSARVPDQPQPRPIHARVFGGEMLGSGEVKLSGDYPFSIEGRLFDSDLATISREATASRQNITGRAYADLRLVGNSFGAHTLQGAGTMQLRNADIYELPVLVSLLKILAIKRPNSTAFTSSDIKYRIEGDRFYFDHIDFDGDAVSLDGQGELTFDGAVNLAFYTSLGNDGVREYIIRPFFKEAGKRLVQIQVTGTILQPEVKRQIAPELNNTLQTLFPGEPGASRPVTSRLPRPTDPFDRATSPR